IALPRPPIRVPYRRMKRARRLGQLNENGRWSFAAGSMHRRGSVARQSALRVKTLESFRGLCGDQNDKFLEFLAFPCLGNMRSEQIDRDQLRVPIFLETSEMG